MTAKARAYMPSDEELVDWFVQPVRMEMYSPEEWAATTGLLSGRRVRQLAQGEWDRINKETRRSLLRLAEEGIHDLDLEYMPPEPEWLED